MKIYLVGGAVRDALLGREVLEKDYVVVGATVPDMLAEGFKPVGKAFPVFLHPKTKEEYALARTEKKTAKGYHGFSFYTDPSVTLEEDLKRRDLTINAIAQDETGHLIDPYHGQADLKAKLLHHVSDAFAEDPVRILRVARFAARFHHLGFKVADDTLALMKKMVTSGEVDALVPERVFKELQGALSEQTPSAFFTVLRDCGALAVLFPDLERLFGVPQRKAVHPEIDCGIHTLMVLDTAARLTPDPVIRFAALVHDLGKGDTPEAQLPSHKGHEALSVKRVDALCAHYRLPNDYTQLARLVAGYHGQCHNALSLDADALLDLFTALDLFRRPERLEPFLIACQADSLGRKGHENDEYPQAAHIKAVFEAANDINPAEIAQNHRGEAIKTAIAEARRHKIVQYLNNRT